MKKRKLTAGHRMIESAKQAVAFAQGKENHGCDVHVPGAGVKSARRPREGMSDSDRTRHRLP
jgi:hypothetical protein